MRVVLAGLALLAAATASCIPSGKADSGATPALIRVLALNEFHGQLEPVRPDFGGCRALGGADVLARYLDRARAGAAAPVLVVDGGDSYHRVGDETDGEEAVEFLNRIGVAAAALGNHELRGGGTVLLRRMAQARFPWLAANVYVAGTDTLPGWLNGTHIVVADDCGGSGDCAPVRVGFAGVTTDAASGSPAAELGALEVGDPASALDAAVRRLRVQDVDFAVGLVHAGAVCSGPDASDDCRGEVVDIARRLRDPPDLIVAGHTHTRMNAVVNGIPIVQAESRGTRFSIIDLDALSSEAEPIGHFSGLVVVHDLDAPPGRRVIEATLPDGRPLAPGTVYLLAANEYIADGGAGFHMLAGLSVHGRSELDDLDALVEYLRREPEPLGAAEAPRLRPLRSRVPDRR